MKQIIKNKNEKEKYNYFIRKESMSFEDTKQEMLDDTLPNANPNLNSSNNIDDENIFVEQKDTKIIELPFKKKALKFLGNNVVLLIISAIILPFIIFYFFNYVEYRENIAIIKTNINNIENHTADIVNGEVIKIELENLKREINDKVFVDIKDIQKRLTIIETRIDMKKE